ncbi:MAG: YCF48-related protein [Chloroflexi bacterium]|nr:YCF48-related protein [Chloroflexota bacterium]
MKSFTLVLPIVLVLFVACIPVPTGRPEAPLAIATLQGVTPTPSTPTGILTDTSTPARAQSSAPSPIGTSAEPADPGSFQVGDLAFVDALHGWALGQYGNANGIVTTAVRVTVDGGRSWQATGAPPTRMVLGGPAVSKIRFANTRDGWTFDPGLFSTHDGGHTWIDESPSGDVIAVEPDGGTVWAVERTCKDAVAKNDCRFALLLSNQGAQGWQPAPTPLPATVLRHVRVSTEQAWILSTEAGSLAGRQLWVTRDGGQTWSEPNPSASISRCEHVAMDETRQLWLLCGGATATNMQQKWLLVSQDEGKHWTKIGDQTLPWLGGIMDLDVVSHQRAFIALARYAVIATTDGGGTWQPTRLTEGDVLGGYRRVLFVDEWHGWALPGQWYVDRTEDGGITWEEVALP